MGALTIYAGLEVAYLGFGGLTTIIGISTIIYFIWAGILGGFMWKKSMYKAAQTSFNLFGLNGFCNLYMY